MTSLDSFDALRAENTALRERLSGLSYASLRINESLDLEAVLEGILDSARLLTGARYALITTVDDGGQAADFVVSGLTHAESEQLWGMPEGLEIFRYLSFLGEPLRVRNFGDHVLSLGLPAFRAPAPVTSFLAVPIRHRDESVGFVCVGNRDRGVEFSREDEETLVMLASQAALVITNARRHRDEQRARADLEALVDTSPVGVVVLDAQTGTLVSVNGETARMLGGLLPKGRPIEHLLEILTIRRADGTEVSLQDIKPAQALRAGETVRAERIAFHAPNGHSVTAIMNATPIRSEDGQVKSFVITLQDMTPFEELERLRAEFLGMVSHELRAPLSSIKGSATTLLGSGTWLDPAEMVLFFQIINQQADHMSSLISDLLDMARIETGGFTVIPAPAEVAVLVDDARNMFLSGGGRHNIAIDLEPDVPRVLADRRRAVQVLTNLLSNAARHSPESSPIHVSATADGAHVAFCVADEGEGMSPERLSQLFGKFHLVDHSNPKDKTGSPGLGLAICKGIVEAHGGRIRAESDGPKRGARFTFTLPTAEDRPAIAPATPSRTGGLRKPGKRNRIRVIAVDDDPQTLWYVRDILRDAGYAPTVTGDPQQVAALIREHKPHLVLLDLMLPETDGIQLLTTVPQLTDTPVIFLSAYGRDHTIARALEAGAVDYIVKPFSPTELVARIQAALRHQATPQSQEPSEPYQTGELTIDYASRTASLAGRPLKLTGIEYRLLVELSANGGQVLTHHHLLQQVWGLGHPGHSGPIRTAIKNLRRKLGDNAHNPTYIFNEPRIGYRMPEPNTQPHHSPGRPSDDRAHSAPPTHRHTPPPLVR